MGMNGLRIFSGHLAALRDHWKFIMFFSRNINHPSISAKYTGKLVVTRVDVLPSEQDDGREDKRDEEVCRGVVIQGPCILTWEKGQKRSD